MTPLPIVSQDELAIRRLIEDWARAVRGGDRAGILAHHHPDILMFDVPPPFVSRGIAAYDRTWDTFFREADYQGVFEIDELSVSAGSEVAFAMALMHCGTWDADSPQEQLAFRVTVGLRKLEGKWTVMHEHHSIPAKA